MSGEARGLAVLMILMIGLLGAGAWFLLSTDSTEGEMDSNGSTHQQNPEQPTPSEVEDNSTDALSGPVETQPFEENQPAGGGGFPQVPQGSGISGVVVAESGAPISGARVALRADTSAIKARPREGAVIAHGITSATGTYQFPFPTRGTSFLVRVDHDDYASDRHFPIHRHDESTWVGRVLLAGGKSLKGSVVDQGGLPLADVTLEIYDLAVASEDPGGCLERKVRSDERGAFEFRHLKPGNKRLVAWKKGYAKDGRQAIEVPYPKVRGELKLQLVPGATISGVVQDEVTGHPVPNALVTCRPTGSIATPNTHRMPPNRDSRGGAELREAPSVTVPREPGMSYNAMPRLPQMDTSTRTDEHGQFILEDVAEALFAVQVKADGYAFLAGRSARAGQNDVVLKLTPSPRIVGKVVDGQSGLPVPSFSLTPGLSDKATYAATGGKQFASKDGQFSLEVPRPGQWFVHVRADGYAPGVSTAIPVQASQASSPITITLSQGTTVTGLVTNGAGEPVPSADVELIRPGPAGAANPFSALFRQTLRRDQSMIATTGSDGTWTIENIPSGEYRVLANSSDYTSEESDNFRVREEQEIFAPTVTLRKGGSVRGVVRKDDGTPDPKAMIMISADDPGRFFSQTTNSDAQGTYEFTGLKPGRYKMVLTQRNGQIQFARLIQSKGEPDRRVALDEGQTQTIDF